MLRRHRSEDRSKCRPQEGFERSIRELSRHSARQESSLRRAVCSTTEAPRSLLPSAFRLDALSALAFASLYGSSSGRDTEGYRSHR